MPVVRRRDRDGIELRRRQELANIGEGRRVRVEFFARFVRTALHAIEDGGVDIAERDDAHALDPRETVEVIPAAAVEADNGDADIAVRAGDLAPRTGGQRDGASCNGGALNEGTTSEGVHIGGDL